MRYDYVKDLPDSAASTEKPGCDVYRTILESIDQGYCTIEVAFDEDEKPVDYCFLEVSSSFERLTGIENGAGRWMREIAPDQDQFWFDIYGRVARTGEPERFENFSTPLDRWFSVHAFKIEGPARIAVLFDDITDSKRAQSELRRSEEQFQALFDQAPLGVYLVDSDFVIRQVNPVALPVFGDIPGGPVGRDFDEVIHILWDKEYADEVVGIFRHTLETGEPYFTPERAEYRADRDVIEYYEWRVDRILLPGGRNGVVAYFRDVSAQVNARKEIEKQRESARENGERYRTLFEAIDSGFCILEMIFDDEGRAADYRFLEANPAFERQSGLVGAVGHRIREFAPDLEEHWFERYGRVALTGEPMRVEGEAAALGRWFDINAFRVGDPEQRRVAVLFTDISARRKAAEELRDSEERQAFLLKLSDALASLSDPADIEAAAARLVAEQLGVSWCYFNEFDDCRTHATVMGDFHRDGLASMVGSHDLSGERDFLDLMCSGAMLDMPDLLSSEHFSAQAKAHYGALGIHSVLGAPLLRSGRLAAVFLVADTKARRWTRGDSELLRGVAERTWAAIQRARAHAALSESEQRQRLLLGELQHRVRNILAMIRSVARRTAETSETVQDYAQHLEGRINAMARTQALLTRTPGSPVDLEDIVQSELLSVAAQEKEVWCEGPVVRLEPKAAEVFTLAIHELATNAVKYGAFSQAAGQLEIGWKVEERGGEQWLSFTWEEARVDGVHKNVRTGFGTELITRKVPYELSGSGTYELKPGGLCVEIAFPLRAGSSILETRATGIGGPE